MTSANNFTIDSALAPVDANMILEKLKEWLAEDGRGKLEIAPLPEAPELPTQPALQLFLSAAAELTQGGDNADHLDPDTFAFCNRLLCEEALVKPRKLEAENG